MALSKVRREEKLDLAIRILLTEPSFKWLYGPAQLLLLVLEPPHTREMANFCAVRGGLPDPAKALAAIRAKFRHLNWEAHV